MTASPIPMGGQHTVLSPAPVPCLPRLSARAATGPEFVQFWPRIRTVLKDILKAQGPRASWTPLHVHAALLAGRAELWIVTGYQSHSVAADDTLWAFAITTPYVDALLNAPVGLFVWFLWRDRQRPRGAIAALATHLTAIARARGCEYIEGTTTFEGAAQACKQHGCEIVGYVVRKHLYEEEP